MTHTPPKTVEEILNNLLDDMYYEHDRADNLKEISYAKLALKKLVLERLPAPKDVKNMNIVNAVYNPPPKDGDVITFTHINNDERRGFNECLEKVKSIIEEIFQ